jgi:hypothetical protein
VLSEKPPEYVISQLRVPLEKFVHTRSKTKKTYHVQEVSLACQVRCRAASFSGCIQNKREARQRKDECMFYQAYWNSHFYYRQDGKNQLLWIQFNEHI